MADCQSGRALTVIDGGERPEEAHAVMGGKMKFPTITTPQAPELVGDAN